MNKAMILQTFDGKVKLVFKNNDGITKLICKTVEEARAVARRKGLVIGCEMLHGEPKYSGIFWNGCKYLEL